MSVVNWGQVKAKAEGSHGARVGVCSYSQPRLCVGAWAPEGLFPLLAAEWLQLGGKSKKVLT